MSTPEVIDISQRLTEAMAASESAAVGPIAPVPGVYNDLPFLEYARINAVSQSRLNKLVPPSTPAHCLAYMLTPPAKTPALLLGDATHCAILEPDSFDSRFIRAIEGDGRTKAVKEAREAQARAFPNACVLSPADYDTTVAVRDAVWQHPAARALLQQVNGREVSIVWNDAVTGEPCKARLDAFAGGLSMLLDLKSTRNASRDAFMGSIRTYGYHRQAAMYREAADLKLPEFGPRLPWEHYVFIAFEKVPPYAVAVYRLQDTAIEAGRTEIANLRALYSKCRKENHWPAYSDAIEDIGIDAQPAIHLEA